MAWTIAGVTAHVSDDQIVRESLYALQNVLDATATTKAYYGAKSETRSLTFWLLPEDSASGMATIEAATIANADIALTSDQGSEGNWRALSFKPKRVMDVTRSGAVWNCVIELIKSD